MKKYWIVAGLFVLSGIYLFVTAPQPLPDGIEKSQGKKISINEVFRMLSDENNRHRGLYTIAVVGVGLKTGLKFDEHWEEAGIDAGPLPALFLRGTARELERTGLQMGLFLGSDFPIASSNKFNEAQMERHNQILASGEAQFFFDQSSQRYTAMFPDVAVAAPCVTCHNEHPQSPKHDWKLNDIMGATTWSFPSDSVTIDEALSLIQAYRTSARSTYEKYLEKINTFSSYEVSVSNSWPSVGDWMVPSADVFCDSVYKNTSSKVLARLLSN
jgi:hypothetical protein